MVVAWNVFRAAILPVPLTRIGAVMQRFVEHLGRSADHHRDRRIDIFLNMIEPEPG